jgi:phospholipid/cholesterol/gamma-HCH transport system ATP-binding protein
MSPKIQVKNLKKSFDRHEVLKNVSFSVNQGESLVILGGSGSGKSVTLKCILGLIEPDFGSIIKIDGQDIRTLTDKQFEKVLRKFGMLFQGGALFDSLPVWENISFSLINNYDMSRSEAKDLAIEKLASVGLGSDVADKYPAELSGGMKKRVSLARAIAPNPEILFFDEPTAGLDPIMCTTIDSLIVKCSKKLGATTVTITHDIASLRRIADKVAMLYKGEIIWYGTRQEMEESDNPYLKQFISGSQDGPIKAA